MRLLIIFLLIGQTIFAQKYITRTGITEFKASVDAFEPVEAINRSTSAIFTKKGDIASQLFVSAFLFKVALMQEHFNENYMDSDIHPKAIFRGKIESFDFEKLSSDETYTLKGKLTIRGISKELSFPVLLSKTNKRINLKGTFSVNPKNFGIEIPNIIRKKIARKINITINYELSKKE